MEYHVAKNGADTNKGTQDSPFLTINAAAAVAVAGDTVTVHEGEYREWVQPRHGGLSPLRRITYAAAENEKVVIKGSERVRGWENAGGNVWKAVVPGSLFGGYNPFEKPVIGDWLVFPVDRTMHLGDVYLNGMSFYEAASLDAVKKPVVRSETLDHRTGKMSPLPNPQQTQYLWYAEAGADSTVIWANFNGADPNAELVEINVRKCCFYPEATGLDYITVRGFELAQAATPWAPPTGDQPGLIGPHWAKGWIIEDNIIHDAKCSAISIGKEASTGDNWCTFRRDKPGYQYQLESVFSARKIGWSKETIGSHIIRNNTIYDCGQNGIVGHLGCVFSDIYHNHIYRIALKREFYGHEIAGIKLHAAVDTHIHGNNIHDCSLGIWLDWQAQGTRISKNLFYRNNRDLFMEVTHGPFLVDYNIFGSAYMLDNVAQGGAYVHNLVAGRVLHEKVLNRATPYHAPHSTDVAGYAFVYGGDDRWYQNIFAADGGDADIGTRYYDGYTTSMEEYLAGVDKMMPGDSEIYDQVEQPVYIEGNAYFGAKAFGREANKLDKPSCDIGFKLEETGDGLYLVCDLPQEFAGFVAPPHTTATLGHVRVVDADYENFDGSPLTLDSDYLGGDAAGLSVAGPLAGLKAGANRVRVW